ncbi:MAG: sensor histidine kinase, partial [Planctomycetota bacterium]
LSSISHELRTPLTNICSSVEILIQTDFENRDEWREFCGFARNGAMQLNGLVDAVIYYSQIETGQITWSFEYFDMADLLTNARRSLEQKAREEDLTLELIGTTDDLATRADHARTQDLILRLLDNAIKFTPGGGRIQLQAENRGDVIRVSVADSGSGVPENHRERVFERFAQLGDILTEKPVGTGLGLAICQRVAEAMGGKIWCEDSRFGGACFVFELPAAQVRAQEPQAV